MGKFEWVDSEEILPQLMEQFEALRREEAEAIEKAQSTDQLEEIRKQIFGKKGRFSVLMKEMSVLTSDERPKAGQAANAVKTALQENLEAHKETLRRQELARMEETEALDISLPGRPLRTGTLHPVTRVLREMEDIFLTMGFSVALGPEIEDDFHNFGALNIPEEHPARDMQDTFYLPGEWLLRTHTSPVQIHVMQKEKPPLAIIAPGKVYRCDADVTHSPMFHQVEGLMVDEHIRFSDLKGVLEAFIHRMFGPDTDYRLRPHYFPFTEPSAEVDILFERRHPNGHMVRDWLEILGSGMVHPKVLEACGIDPEKYRGFAFGMGVERIAMLKYGINSIHHFCESDVRFLQQFQG